LILVVKFITFLNLKKCVFLISKRVSCSLLCGLKEGGWVKSSSFFLVRWVKSSSISYYILYTKCLIRKISYNTLLKEKKVVGNWNQNWISCFAVVNFSNIGWRFTNTWASKREPSPKLHLHVYKYSQKDN
jgi:hypothetical protein